MVLGFDPEESSFCLLGWKVDNELFGEQGVNVLTSHLQDPVCHLAQCICCDWGGIRPGQLGLIPLTKSRH